MLSVENKKLIIVGILVSLILILVIVYLVLYVIRYVANRNNLPTPRGHLGLVSAPDFPINNTNVNSTLFPASEYIDVERYAVFGFQAAKRNKVADSDGKFKIFDKSSVKFNDAVYRISAAGNTDDKGFTFIIPAQLNLTKLDDSVVNNDDYEIVFLLVGKFYGAYVDGKLKDIVNVKGKKEFIVGISVATNASTDKVIISEGATDLDSGIDNINYIAP